MRPVIHILIFITVVLHYAFPAAAQDSRQGYWFPPEDTLRIFLIYAEMVNDPDDPGWIRGWEQGKLPPDPAYLFDHRLGPGETPGGVLTRYYYQASFGKYIVLADHYPEMVSIDYNSANGRGIEQAMDMVFNVGGDDIRTANGYSLNRGDFDHMSTSRMGYEKKIAGDSLVDLVMVMWRVNSRMTKDASAGFCVPANRHMKVGGMKGMNAYSSFVNKDYTSFRIIRHEYSHLLLGGNNFHTGGAGAGTKTFMSDAGGYAMLSCHNNSSPVYCSFDRRRLGWKHPEHAFQISARDPEDGSEIEANLKYGAVPLHGSNEFILRDFVETGDAIRIQLPYLRKNSASVENQWLWLENHQKLQGNIDHEGATRAGLYAYIQVGKEISRGSGAYGGLCNYTWPVSAFGNYDFRIDEEKQESEISNEFSNPLTGYNNLIYGAYDLGQKDGRILRNEVFLSKRIRINGRFPHDSNFIYRSYHIFGTSWDAFQVGDKIGIDRNPSAASLLTYRTSPGPRANPLLPASSDSRVVHLNGISVEFLEQLPDGSIRLGIRFDDTVLQKDVRWCGDIRLHETISLDRGTEIRLEQGLTPTRPLNPVMFRGEQIFADPTSLRLTEGAAITMNKRSRLVVKEGSSLLLEAGSRIELERGSRIVVSDSSSLMLEPGAVITGRGKVILHRDASAEIGKGNVQARLRRLRK